MDANSLRVLSVFLTVDGEANVWGQGHWSVFVRFAGCTVGCKWCDTKYSWNDKGGEEFTPGRLIESVKLIGGDVRKVTITGGEPLEQQWIPLARFIGLLLKDRYNVSVETAGTENTDQFRAVVSNMYPDIKLRLGQLSFVVDYKLKSSGFHGRMDMAHFSQLRYGDVVKFVVGNEADFDEAMEVVRALDAAKEFNATMYFSPQDGGQWSTSELFYNMRKAGADQFGVGYNLQMHKIIFPNDPRGEEEDGIDFTKRTLGRREFLDKLKNQ